MPHWVNAIYLIPGGVRGARKSTSAFLLNARPNSSNRRLIFTTAKPELRGSSQTNFNHAPQAVREVNRRRDCVGTRSPCAVAAAFRPPPRRVFNPGTPRRYCEAAPGHGVQTWQHKRQSRRTSAGSIEFGIFYVWSARVSRGGGVSGTTGTTMRTLVSHAAGEAATVFQAGLGSAVFGTWPEAPNRAVSDGSIHAASSPKRISDLLRALPFPRKSIRSTAW